MGKQDLCLSPLTVCEGVWVCLVAPSVRSSITPQKQVCTLMKPQGQTCTHTLFRPPVLYLWCTATSGPLKNSAAHTRMRIKLFFSSVIEAIQRHAWSVPKEWKLMVAGFQTALEPTTNPWKGLRFWVMWVTLEQGHPAFRVRSWEEKRVNPAFRLPCHHKPPPQISSVWLGRVHGKETQSKPQAYQLGLI